MLVLLRKEDLIVPPAAKSDPLVVRSIGLRSTDAGTAERNIEVLCRIDRPSRQDHAEKQVSSGRHSCPPDHAKFLASCDRALSLGEGRHDHAEVAVDAQEAIVLDQHLEPARSLALDPDHGAGCGREDR
jgi:hypothetical protein